jgi:hypothetical protein
MKENKGIDIELKEENWMKRFFIIPLIMLFALVGCNTISSNHFEGFILEKKKNSIIVQITGDVPETEYPTHEVFIDDDTEIEGTKVSFSELEVGDDVEVLLENQEADEKIAEIIVVFVIKKLKVRRNARTYSTN